MNDKMKQHASRFDFPNNNNGVSNIVIVERILDLDENYYWIIRLGGSRWSKKYQLFRYRADDETVVEYEEDTKYSLDEAFEIASTQDLYDKHMKYMNEPTIPPTYRVGSTVYELDKAFIREISPDIKTNDELAKARADKLKEEDYQVFILIGSRGDMVFDAIYKVKKQLKPRQKVSKAI